MNSEFTFEIQRPASEVEQLLARARRCLTPPQAAELDAHLAQIRARIAAGAFEKRGLNASSIAAAAALSATALRA